LKEVIMYFFRASLVFCAIAAFAGTAMASSGSLVEFKPRVMPVLVQVNANGRVTDIQPSFPLTPWSQKLLAQQLDAWIDRPATYKGRPVSSRFIVEVAMHTQSRKDGKYDASFVYVKSLPAPFGGSMHWNIIDGGLEVALVADGTGHTQWRAPLTAHEWRGRFAENQPHAMVATAHGHSAGHAQAATYAQAPAEPQATRAMPSMASAPSFSRAPVARQTNAPATRIR
jgi:hypothetical protein